MASQDHAVRHNNELLTQARAGDKDALSALIVDHAALVRSTVRNVVEQSNTPHAERSDLINASARQALTLATREFESFSGSYPQLAHWIRVISRSHALEAIRDHHNKKPAVHVDEFGYRTVKPAHEIPTSRTDPEHRLARNDQAWALQILEQSLDWLVTDDADLHQLIWLKYKKGWSDEQIQTYLADEGVNISPRDLNKRIKKLREYLGARILEHAHDG